MAQEKPPHTVFPTTPRHPPVVHKVPDPITTRHTVNATRSTTPPPGPHPATYQPWQQLQASADARYKTELHDALNHLEAAAAAAGQILDRASAMAAESGARLEAAAWAAWKKYMTAADETRNGILEAAVAAYEEAITTAETQYAKALQSAETVYKSIINDVNRAKNDVKAIVA